MRRAPGTLRQLLKLFAVNFGCGYSSMKEVSIPWLSSRYSETSLDLVRRTCMGRRHGGSSGRNFCTCVAEKLFPAGLFSVLGVSLNCSLFLRFCHYFLGHNHVKNTYSKGFEACASINGCLLHPVLPFHGSSTTKVSPTSKFLRTGLR
jgi:hypothetical protein